MKKAVKKTAIKAVGIIAIATFAITGCDKNENNLFEKKGQCGEMSDSLYLDIEKQGLKFPNIVNGRLFFKDNDHFTDFMQRLYELNSGDLIDYTKSNCFTSLLDATEENGDEPIMDENGEIVSIEDPYFCSVLNTNRELTIADKRYKITADFVFLCTEDKLEIINEFKNEFTQGSIQLDYDSTFQYSKDLLVCRIMPNETTEKHIPVIRPRDFCDNINGDNKLRIKAVTFCENYLIVKSAGFKTVFQRKKAGIWRGEKAPYIAVEWVNCHIKKGGQTASLPTTARSVNNKSDITAVIYRNIFGLVYYNYNTPILQANGALHLCGTIATNHVIKYPTLNSGYTICPQSNPFYGSCK